MGESVVGRIASLLRATADAHHEAFADSDGADADWPIWYAHELRDELAELLGRDLTVSVLTYLLVGAELEDEGSPEDWPLRYAAFVVRGLG